LQSSGAQIPEDLRARRADSHDCLPGQRPHSRWDLEAREPADPVDPVDGSAIPFTPDARTRYEANKAAAAKGDNEFDPSFTRCSSPGPPRLMFTPARFRIFQRPTIVTFMFEWNRLLRQIALPGNLAGLRHEMFGADLAAIGTMKGSTQGHWDGGTLVAESSGFMDGKLIDGMIPGSDQLKLTEHIRLRDRDTLEDRSPSPILTPLPVVGMPCSPTSASRTRHSPKISASSAETRDRSHCRTE
jgi:hypothetical protein